MNSGFVPWLDEEELLAGQDWQLEIAKAVRAVDVVIVCLSRSSVGKAGFVQREIKHALDVADEQPEGTIFLIPVKLEECETPERLRRWHWVNLFEDRGYERLVAALQHRAIGLGLAVVAEHAPATKQASKPGPEPVAAKNPSSGAGGRQKKVCIVGATGVGKTSLVARFVNSLFSSKYLTTVGVKIDRKDITIGARPITMVLWDIEGRDQFQELRSTYVLGAHGFFFVADGTRRSTLKDLLSMASSLDSSLASVPSIVVVNKADLEAEWEIHPREIDALRADGRFVIRGSAKTGVGVEDAFRELGRRIVENE